MQDRVNEPSHEATREGILIPILSVRLTCFIKKFLALLGFVFTNTSDLNDPTIAS